MSLWRYRDRLPVDPHVTLEEGDTPLIAAPRLSARTGCEVWLKFEGANPTGSFKDRGMTVAVSAAVEQGAEAVICASTGNTAASAAAYAARAGLRGAVIVPEGKIATGKLAQALVHGARVIALRGNFDEALKLVRELVERHPIALVNSVNPYRLEGQKTGAFEILRRAGGGAGRARHPRGQRGQHLGLLEGLPRVRGGPSPARLPGRGRRPARARPPGGAPRDRRLGHPDRQPRALGGGHGRRDRLARGDRAVSDPEILEAYSFLSAEEGVFCEPACAAAVAGLMKYGADGRVVVVITGHGLKDPTTALDQARGVIPCEPEIGSVEEAVLG